MLMSDLKGSKYITAICREACSLLSNMLKEKKVKVQLISDDANCESTTTLWLDLKLCKETLTLTFDEYSKRCIYPGINRLFHALPIKNHLGFMPTGESFDCGEVYEGVRLEATLIGETLTIKTKAVNIAYLGNLTVLKTHVR